MEKQKSIEAKVYDILEKHPDSRGDDFVLYGRYIQENFKELRYFGLIYALMRARELGMPSYEGVTRARRKIQQLNPDLRPPEKARAAREEKEREFRRYAKIKY